ncbi:DUF4148 domain-containing protein [Paraburkholderia sp. BL10I2N1]|uniref:DUF4148 domain-containing protein n=1 Tax=Paraburkholderia sp. BL10I2N1 TaxID=1938796 RepID=UPI0010E8BEB9|nr:DUF4148 domain-containing protein [Paraburkholderia sp. BL10I2N1]TDN62484.1 uncharacterized protein DUF4148 [Paraburkholderia sp. BL10I2N1]
MIRESRKIFLAGLVISALAITAYVSRSNQHLAGDQSSFERNDASASRGRDDMASGSVRLAPAFADSSSNAGMAQTLEAARDSLRRNDLVSARVLLDSMRSLHQDDEEVQALERDLRAREDMAEQASPVAHPEKAPETVESPRPGPRSRAKADRLRGGTLAMREHAASASRHVQAGTTQQVKIAPNTSADIQATSPAPEAVEVESAARQAASAVSGAPAVSQPIGPMQPDAEARQAVQTVQPASMPTAPDAGPKTRAQVRAELDRARTNGGIPRFGNPDPAGPGGTPSLPRQPAAPAP